MEEAVARGLADRLEKYVKGSFQGIFSQKSNVNFGNQLTVFGIKNLTDELRPTAIFIILDYIWTKVKRDLKKRLLVVDEAWYLMKSEDSATFLYGIAKRARKYFLGLTTITQDVEDFLKMMQHYADSQEEFDLFVVPVVKDGKQQADTVNTIRALRATGVPAAKILVPINKVETDDDLEEG